MGGLEFALVQMLSCIAALHFENFVSAAACPDGTFGVNCKEQCGKCSKNISCDKTGGMCSGGCEGRFRPPLCKMKYPVFDEAPRFISHTLTSITISVDNISFSGDIYPTNYHLQYVKVESANQGGSWITFGTFAYSAKVKQHEIPCLEVRSSYGVRVVLIDETGTGYNGTDIPCAVYNTSCIHPDKVNTQLLQHTIRISWQLSAHHCNEGLYVYDVKENGSNTTDPQLPFGLKPFTDYRWTLRYGNMLILVGNITTPESAPERPEHLQVIKRTPHAIWLTWQRPRVTNGLLRKFIICVKLLSSELRRQDRSRKLLEEEIKVTLSMNYSYEVKDLEPSSEYNVSVRGMTVEPGEPAVLNSVKTSLIVPDIGSQLKLVDDYIASTILQVIIPPADSFLAKNSSYFVVVTSDKEEVAASLTKLKMMEFILKTANVKNDGRSWIAAEIEPQDEEQLFKVGDNRKMISGTSGDVYWNRPLEPGLLYDLTLVALNWQDGEYESSFAKLKHPDQALSEKEGGIGAEWSALLLLLIIPVAVYFVIRKTSTRT
ncbi:uncharacterized protein LOC110831292 isoform X2 [Zootermopsis nevadensis]|uniref:uncharacterized protein LOC110831292 isoform X2 n=1 Tax=Zootermopsis nevadensis TaxID=136037 RepID=UPI000B8ED354|nr:uncharacterized protein LOC110831292 isoform X2 [Zootermopsis nevadensis]